jgi:hypothetical protein
MTRDIVRVKAMKDYSHQPRDIPIHSISSSSLQVSDSVMRACIDVDFPILVHTSTSKCSLLYGYKQTTNFFLLKFLFVKEEIAYDYINHKMVPSPPKVGLFPLVFTKVFTLSLYKRLSSFECFEY